MKKSSAKKVADKKSAINKKSATKKKSTNTKKATVRKKKPIPKKAAPSKGVSRRISSNSPASLTRLEVWCNVHRSLGRFSDERDAKECRLAHRKLFPGHIVKISDEQSS